MPQVASPGSRMDILKTYTQTDKQAHTHTCTETEAHTNTHKQAHIHTKKPQTNHKPNGRHIIKHKHTNIQTNPKAPIRKSHPNHDTVAWHTCPQLILTRLDDMRTYRPTLPMSECVCQKPPALQGPQIVRESLFLFSCEICMPCRLCCLGVSSFVFQHHSTLEP